MPTAIIPTIEHWTKIFSQFVTVKKLLESDPITAHSITNPKSIIFLDIIFKALFGFFLPLAN
ncbi:hypothetical protein CFSAN002368_19776 [Clostridium botulinum A1 str. CFSAN002368]|nr:hypothetical protein CFSAN002368_19776 [Clostridium botulinum A1 str. CFSAN002368]